MAENISSAAIMRKGTITRRINSLLAMRI